MARLKKPHKELIVRSLACYEKPVDIQQKLKDEFGVEVSTSQISFYNPENNSSKNLARAWRELHRSTRNQYKDEIARHDIAAKGYRLGLLQKAVEKLFKMENYALMAQLLEQAAKEVGGAYEGEDPETGEGITVNNYIQQVYNKIENR